MAESVLAEFDSFGARVCIVGDASTGTPAGDACPEWVKVGQGLMEARCREYEQATGHWPEMRLLERFSAEMGKRLDDFIRDPKGHPWKAMGLREYEEEAEGRK